MNKKTVLCLSGWAQKSTSLQSLAKNLNQDFDVVNFDYSKFDNVDSFFEAIKDLGINPDIIIGHSLGGQLSSRLIHNKILKPKSLVLIGAPFQFVKSPRIPAAMPESAFLKFKNNFINSPDQTLKKFSILMTINDKNAKEMIKNLEINEHNHQKLSFWLKQLEEFSCYDINFANFPKTLIIHGDGDMVVHNSQGKIFAEKIINSKLKILKSCGHAPHLSNSDVVSSAIKQFIN